MFQLIKMMKRKHLILAMISLIDSNLFLRLETIIHLIIKTKGQQKMKEQAQIASLEMFISAFMINF